MSAALSRQQQHWYRMRQVAHLNAALSYRYDHAEALPVSTEERAMLAWNYADRFIARWEERYPMPELDSEEPGDAAEEAAP